MEGRKDETPRPVVTFFQPRSSQELVLFSLFAGHDAAVRKFLPKSHVSNVIIRDNTSVQRLQEIKLRHLDNSQRKNVSYYEQVKKKFVHDQQNKMNRWKKQYNRYQRMLEEIDQRAIQGAISNNAVLTAQKSSVHEQRSILKKK
ncbi:uncharacterized protein C5orf52 homolog [Eublepharis macularius]|uniref:Uncharacterized protein C5orf52 homolog n=1 Tax=Eublepharis macularius TaxID=481883 RepID=A0AA97K9P9_EUBMA|nr:uncharacterized protein C5orf52 homolog [Eublepharis macularius]